MSKYFEETFGENNPTATVSAKPWTSVKPPAEETEAPGGFASRPVRPPAGETEAPRGFASRPVEPPKSAVPVSRTLRFQFAEEDTMGAFQESYRALRTRLLRLRSEKGLRSVAVTSAAKGDGKTLTSLNLAYSCAQLQDMRVLLVDADIRSFGLSRLVHAPAGQGVSDILAEKGEPEHAILPTDLPNLHFLRGGSEVGAPAELLASRRWLQLMDWCAQTYSLVIVDTPPILTLTDVELITAGCDGMVMIVRSQETLAEDLHQCAAQIDSKKLLGVVLNGAHVRGEAYKYGYAGAAAK
jgi:capsular exopolysaccharide synthesis family protein